MQPLVSAIVLNYRTGREAWKCVESLLRQTIVEKMEILVIDNHSDDESIAYVRNRARKFPQVKILESPHNLGFGAGYNLGFRHARGRYFLLNNPAKILAPDAVEKMTSELDRDPSIGIIGPKLLFSDGTIRDSYRSFPRPLDVVIKRTALRQFFTTRMRRYLQWDRNQDQAGTTDWVIGGCLMIRADLCRQLHGFDERFFLFFEDTDLCRRCALAGKSVLYFPQAVATDRKRRLSEGGVFSMLMTPVGRAHIVSGVRYFWKWKGV